MSQPYNPLKSPTNRSSYQFQLHSPTPPPPRPPGLGHGKSSPGDSEEQELLVPDMYSDPDALLSPPMRPRTTSRPKGPKAISSPSSSRRTSMLASASSPLMIAPVRSSSPPTFVITDLEDASRQRGPGPGKWGPGTNDIPLGTRTLPAGAGKPQPQATGLSPVDLHTSDFNAYTPNTTYNNPFSPETSPHPAKVVFSTASTPRSSTYSNFPKEQRISDPLLRKITFQSSPISTPGELDKDFAYPFSSPLDDSYGSSNLDYNANEYGFRRVNADDFDDDPYKTSANNRVSTYSTATIHQHPFGEKFHSFERPQWRNFGIHFALCAVAYPVLLIFVILARGKDLFWARVLVGVGCGVTGLTLGFSLLRLSRPIIEATTWATLIHQSRVAKEDKGGIRLKDFAAHTDDPTSAVGALKLMWDRHQYHGTIRSNRKSYDRRPWSLWIVFFLANVGLAGALTFIFGRLVAIQVHIIHQYKNYEEFPVKGEITQGDIDRAVELNKAFENYALTWTLAPFSTHGGLPSVVSFPWASENTTTSEPSLSPRSPPYATIPDAKPGNDMVYFAEVISNQLVPGGSGFGTFEDTSSPVNGSSAIIGGIGSWATEDLASGPIVELDPGAVLRFPRWGIRIHCEKVNTIIPRSESNKTYVFIPRDTLGRLFNHFNSSLPAAFDKTVNTTIVRGSDGVNDTMPADNDLQSLALGGKFYDNGVAHSMMSVPLSMGQNNSGSIITIETILVRLNTTYAEHGKFPLLSNDTIPDVDGNPTRIGYDAAVCLQLYEPWVVEVYNSSVGVPNSIRLCDKGAEVHDMPWNISPEAMKGASLKDEPELSRALNSSHLISPYIAGHQNSVNQMLKDNGRDSFYVPSPTLVSYTDGVGAYGYTELSTEYYAKARAIADASNVLPYLAGSGSTVARLYPDKEVSDVYIHNGFYALTVGVVFLMGTLSTFFVPRLPLGSPRRGFDLFSWMTAFAAREIVPDRASGLEKQMELNDIVQHAGEMRFRYVG